MDALVFLKFDLLIEFGLATEIKIILLNEEQHVTSEPCSSVRHISCRLHPTWDKFRA